MTYPVRFALRRARKTWETLFFICGALFILSTLVQPVLERLSGSDQAAAQSVGTTSPGKTYLTSDR